MRIGSGDQIGDQCAGADAVLLDDTDLAAGFQQVVCAGQPDDTAADDQYIAVCFHVDLLMVILQFFDDELEPHGLCFISLSCINPADFLIAFGGIVRNFLGQGKIKF